MWLVLRSRLMLMHILLSTSFCVSNISFCRLVEYDIVKEIKFLLMP